MADSDQTNREKEIFEGALDHVPGEEQQRYLEAACGRDTVLLARIQALLRADDAGEEFLPERSPTPQAGAPELARFIAGQLTEQPGTQLAAINCWRSSAKVGAAWSIWQSRRNRFAVESLGIGSPFQSS